jgi:hypothetical protein
VLTRRLAKPGAVLTSRPKGGVLKCSVLKRGGVAYPGFLQGAIVSRIGVSSPAVRRACCWPVMQREGRRSTWRAVRIPVPSRSSTFRNHTHSERWLRILLNYRGDTHTRGNGATYRELVFILGKPSLGLGETQSELP